MQVVDSELIIPLTYKPRLLSLLVSYCFTFLVYIPIAILGMYNRSRIEEAHRWNVLAHTENPHILESLHQETVSLLFLYLLFFLLLGLFITYLIRTLRGPSAYLRISHQGIFTTLDTFQMRWEQIGAFVPSTFMGASSVWVLPSTVEQVTWRAKAFSRLLVQLGLPFPPRFLHQKRSPAPMVLAQPLLPMALDELMTAVQEQFATELREHHILVVGWQH